MKRLIVIRKVYFLSSFKNVQKQPKYLHSYLQNAQTYNLNKIIKVVSYGSFVILLMSLDPNEIMSHRYTYMIQ